MKIPLIKEQLNNVSTDYTTYILNKYTGDSLKIENTLKYTDAYTENFIFSAADDTLLFLRKNINFSALKNTVLHFLLTSALPVPSFRKSYRTSHSSIFQRFLRNL